MGHSYPSSLISYIFLFYFSLISYHLHNPTISEARSVSSFQSPTKGKGSSEQRVPGLKIFHRHKHNPPKVLVKDEPRVEAINSPALAANQDKLPAAAEDVEKDTGVKRGGGNYMVTVGFGTPASDYDLILDTGSSVTWIQCQCGSNCYQQKYPIYDPSNSSTFSVADCGNDCKYSEDYLDKSYSSGRYIRDKLTIDADASLILPNFIFGCGQKSGGDFGHAAGMFALGGKQKRYSFLHQTQDMFSATFCYCLPPMDREGYLLFGQDAKTNCSSDQFTPLIQKGDSETYSVNLVGLTIGTKTLSISASGAVDSGTAITRLPPGIYSQLRSEFKTLMDRNKYPVADRQDNMDTCYNLQVYQPEKIPKIVLHFENLDVSLDDSAVVWREDDGSKVCLAFAETEEGFPDPIIGSHQQQKLNVLYDVQQMRLGIGQGKCGN